MENNEIIMKNKHLKMSGTWIPASTESQTGGTKNGEATSLFNSSSSDSHGECTSLSDVEMRRHPSGDDIISANLAVRVSRRPAAHGHLSVQELQEGTTQHEFIVR